MKVIGLTREGYNDAYIVQVTHNELSAALEKGYNNELERLKIGDELKLSDIPDQRGRIVSATNAMTEAYEKFVKAAPVMADVARVIGATAPTGGAS